MISPVSAEAQALISFSDRLAISCAVIVTLSAVDLSGSRFVQLGRLWAISDVFAAELSMELLILTAILRGSRYLTAHRFHKSKARLGLWRVGLNRGSLGIDRIYLRQCEIVHFSVFSVNDRLSRFLGIAKRASSVQFQSRDITRRPKPYIKLLPILKVRSRA